MKVRNESAYGNHLNDHVQAEGDEPSHEDPDRGETGVSQEALVVRVRLALGERDGG